MLDFYESDLLKQPCPKCKSADGNNYSEVTQKNGSRHIAAHCKSCNAFRSYAPQPIKFEASLTFIMPFGKHKGKTLNDIYDTDKDYFIWCAENLTNDIGERFRIILDHSGEKYGRDLK